MNDTRTMTADGARGAAESERRPYVAPETEYQRRQRAPQTWKVRDALDVLERLERAGVTEVQIKPWRHCAIIVIDPDQWEQGLRALGLAYAERSTTVVDVWECTSVAHPPINGRTGPHLRRERRISNG